jgi:large subunit ribosomal protein L5
MTKAKAEANTSGYVPRLKQQYIEAVRPELQKQFKYTNPMRVPEIEKVVLNMGIGEATADRKKVEQATRDMPLIAGRSRS